MSTSKPAAKKPAAPKTSKAPASKPAKPGKGKAAPVDDDGKGGADVVRKSL
jgi:hypothetical protein